MVYVIQFASRIRVEVLSWSCSQAVSKPVWHIPLLCVQWKTPDDGKRNCPKHVEFHSKNKFEKFVHLVGFIIRIYHDAWSRGHQIWSNGTVMKCGDTCSFYWRKLQETHRSRHDMNNPLWLNISTNGLYFEEFPMNCYLFQFCILGYGEQLCIDNH